MLLVNQASTVAQRAKKTCWWWSLILEMTLYRKSMRTNNNVWDPFVINAISWSGATWRQKRKKDSSALDLI